MEVWEQIALDGETGARMLVAEYGNRLFRGALMLCRDEHAAEDLVFRTFERVVDKIASFNPDLSFWNWIYAIMLNFFRSDMRKMKAEVVDDLEIVDELTEGTPAAVARLAEIDAALVRKAVEGLPPILREAVALRYFEDKSVEEMAAMLSVPVGTVKWRLHQARKRLALALNDAFMQ